ncbi:FAD-dependent monooxygenase [Opitutales bacterium]|nr:FAD-dependent monooxygenase [Opitutales bacterium]MDB2681745.1 FAD-dependent monooxygenase [Opitutales bacterium]
MFDHKKTDIIVLGAGPVGLTAAHALANRNTDYVLFDLEKHRNTHSYALALHPETLERLDSFGLVERILESSLQLSKVAIYKDGREKASLDYSMLPLQYPFLAVIRQSELEHILIDNLTVKSKKPMWTHRVRLIEDKGDSLNVLVDRLTEGMTGYAVAHIEMQIDKILNYKANYLIGADGYHSTARQSAGIDFPEISPHIEYAIFEFKTDADLPNEMRILIDGDKTHLFWPLPGGHCRWSFQVDSSSTKVNSMHKDRSFMQFGSQHTPILDRKNLDHYLSKHAPWFNGSVENLTWSILLNCEHRLAHHFGKGRIWLAGDSAHLIPRAGTLSMNVGMREACDLVEIISADASEDERTNRLERYNRHRIAEWQHLLDMDHHISAADQTADWILKHRDSLIGNIPATGETLTLLLAQLHLFDAA